MNLSEFSQKPTTSSPPQDWPASCSGYQFSASGAQTPSGSPAAGPRTTWRPPPRNHVRSPILWCPLTLRYQLFRGASTKLSSKSATIPTPPHIHRERSLLFRQLPSPRWTRSKFLTILIVFEIVIRTGAPAAFRRVPQVLELQEVGPFAPEAKKGGRKSPSQGHQTLGAAGIEKERGKDRGEARGAWHRPRPSSHSLRATWRRLRAVSTPARYPRGPGCQATPPAPRRLRPPPSDNPTLLAKGTSFQTVSLLVNTVRGGGGGTSAENTGLRRSCPASATAWKALLAETRNARTAGLRLLPNF